MDIDQMMNTLPTAVRRYPNWACWARRAGKPLFALMLLRLCACSPSDATQALRYWRELQAESATATEAFIEAAARGDSVGMSVIATEALVSETLHRQRSAGAHHFRKIAATYHRGSVRVYGSGSTILFTYTSNGLRYTGVADLAYCSDVLMVTNVRAPVKID